ncbi:MAG: D-alanyl-D-alanine carboxypeptidase family protein [Oscillospiraceae bacterium]|nr:D-alanyl-D-alanine carboxypeptidase family protein [Oscillospiraceae bacterium]
MNDKGTIAIILTLVILGIFAVDFFIRLYEDLSGAKGELEIVSDSSEPDEPDLTDIIPATTDVNGNSGSGSESGSGSTSASVTTTTTTMTLANMTTTTTMTIPINDANTAYFQAPTASMHSGSLILVDANHPYADTPQLLTFKDFKYAHIRLPSTSLQVNAIVTQPLAAWFNAFYAATKSEKVMIYMTNATTTSNPNYKVGIPERATGLTIDLSILAADEKSHTPFTADGNYAWLNQHAAEYGYVLRYANDKTEKTGQKGISWHYRFVGLPHAIYMKEQNLCLEEYISLVQQHPYNGQHLTYAAGGQNYEVYYVPAATGAAATDIPYPAGLSPQISGDNIGGFIVTVAKP